MRFLLILIIVGGALIGLSYCSVVSEHSVLTQIETSIASPEEIRVPRAAEADDTGAPTTENDDDDDQQSGGLFRFGARNNDVAAFDIAGDADEIGFNCPFGIESVGSDRVAIIDPSADRVLLYSLADDKITSIEQLNRPEGFDVIAAAADQDDLYIGERSLTGRGDILRRFSLGGAGVQDIPASDVYQLPDRVIEHLKARGYAPPADAQAAENEDGGIIVRTQPDSGSVSAVGSDGNVAQVDYEVTDDRFLQLTRQLPSGEAAEVIVHARRPIAFVRLAQINQNGDIYLSMTEELRRVKAYRSDETIIKVPANADEEVALFYVPRSRVCTPRQNTTITPDGDVISIFVRRNDVSLVKLRPKSQWHWRIRTARDTTGVVLMEQFRNKPKPVDLDAAKYPDFAEMLPDRPPLPGKEEDAAANEEDEAASEDDVAAGEEEPAPSAAEPEEDEAPSAEEASAADEPDANTPATDDADGTDADEPSPEDVQGEATAEPSPEETELEEAIEQSPSAPDQTGEYAAALERAFVRVSAGEAIDRRSVVRNACMYLNLKYKLGRENYEPETDFHYGEQSTVTNACASRGNHNLAFWSRPSRLSGRVEEEISGAPYVWAGSDWPWQFVNKIAAGRPAGDVCTKVIIYDAKSAVNSIYAAGVDCSGFVSRAWGGAARYTTRSIPGASSEISFEDLQPGDVLNKAGNHVVMFLFWRGPGEMEVIEATTNRACGGVCARTRKAEEFQGYQAYRPNHIEEGGALTAAEVQEICQNATVAAYE